MKDSDKSFFCEQKFVNKTNDSFESSDDVRNGSPEEQNSVNSLFHIEFQTRLRTDQRMGRITRFSILLIDIL